ncbi:hypothetical protein HYH02_002869 [Chlamydomonas schloesseri]|uniref:Phosphate transporter n=1 Tax=Chlamydomonas schloesseri TaxID=2026947 RepID=A0A835WS30_9CHLO|nr:hypothetical protein HYH02_002869 [Chlamydomonas schloesseri]|eukprot:KAG2452635.1 hypothetical protein HYH02_002869 [Chlamydomonas schloesseri]
MAAFAFGWATGANDVANAFGTSVGAKTLTLRQAVLLAVAFEFTGALVLGRVSTSTIAGGIASIDFFLRDPEIYAYGMVCALAVGFVWQGLASYWEMNVSATHAIIGAIMGFSLVYGGSSAVNWATPDPTAFPPYNGVVPIVASWFVSPLLTGAASAGLFALLRRLVLRRHDAAGWALWILPPLVLFTTWINMYFVFTKGARKMLSEASGGEDWSDATALWVSGGISVAAAAGCTLVAVPLLRRRAASKYGAGGGGGGAMSRDSSRSALLDGGAAISIPLAALDGPGGGGGSGGVGAESSGGSSSSVHFHGLPHLRKVSGTARDGDGSLSGELGGGGGAGGGTSSADDLQPHGEGHRGHVYNYHHPSQHGSVQRSARGGRTNVGAGGGGGVVALGKEGHAPECGAAGGGGATPLQLHAYTALGDASAADGCAVACVSAAEAARRGHSGGSAGALVAAGTAPLLGTDGKRSGIGAWAERLRKAAMYGLEVDIHQVVDEDPLVAAIHAGAEEFDGRAEYVFSYLQVFSAICVIFAHGAGEVGYMAGPLATVYAVYHSGTLPHKVAAPVWCVLVSAFGLVTGLATFGYQVTRAMGTRMAKLTPSRGFCAELATALVILVASQYGLPTSSSQCITGGIVGVGMLEGLGGVNWGFFAKTFASWVSTLLICAAATAALFAQGVHAPSISHTRHLAVYEDRVLGLGNSLFRELNDTLHRFPPGGSSANPHLGRLPANTFDLLDTAIRQHVDIAKRYRHYLSQGTVAPDVVMSYLEKAVALLQSHSIVTLGQQLVYPGAELCNDGSFDPGHPATGRLPCATPALLRTAPYPVNLTTFP